MVCAAHVAKALPLFCWSTQDSHKACARPLRSSCHHHYGRSPADASFDDHRATVVCWRHPTSPPAMHTGRTAHLIIGEGGVCCCREIWVVSFYQQKASNRPKSSFFSWGGRHYNRQHGHVRCNDPRRFKHMLETPKRFESFSDAFCSQPARD